MFNSYKGTDTTEIDLDAECVRLIDGLLTAVTFSGNALEVGDSLDQYFATAKGGKQKLQHDQLALLLEVFVKATWTRDARPIAARAKKAIVAGAGSFKEETGS